jgi:hypothetical protein
MWQITLCPTVIPRNSFHKSKESSVLVLPGSFPVVVALSWDGTAIHALPHLVPSVSLRRQRQTSCKILSSRDLFRPQADSPRLIRRSLAAALHRCTAPRSAPSESPAASSKKWPSGPKNSNFQFSGSGGHNPGCRRLQMPWP